MVIRTVQCHIMCINNVLVAAALLFQCQSKLDHAYLDFNLGNRFMRSPFNINSTIILY